jgi:hypothetical protein
VGNSLDLSGGSYGFIWSKTTLGIDEVGGKDSVDESGLSQSCLAFTTRSGQAGDNKISII